MADHLDPEPAIAFPVSGRTPPPVEVRVNFGVFAGREATPAELDRLAEWLLDEVGDVSIISEERHELDARVEAAVHQVVIQITPEPGRDVLNLTQRIVERAEHWARLCVSERHSEIVDGV
jgi:hypothetical protein